MQEYGVEPTVLSSTTRAVLAGAERRGASKKAILARAGVDSELIAGPRLACELDARVWEAAEKVTGDPDLGVHVCDVDLKAKALGPVAVGAMTCATVGDALGWLASSMPLVNEGARTSYGAGTFREGPPPDRAAWSRSMAEATMAVILAYLRRWTRSDIVPVRVGFQHEAPRRTAELEQFFQCPIVFGQKTNFTTFSAETLAIAPTHAEPAIHSFITRAAARELSELRGNRSFGARVLEVLSAAAGFDADVAHAAGTLGVSVRTLQRRLADEGTAFATIVDEVRRRRALALVEEGKLGFDTISAELGFSDLRAFRRAFRRWTGATPAEYRGVASTRMQPASQ